MPSQAFRDRRVEDGLRAAQIDLSIIRHCWNIAVKEWGIPLPTNPVSDDTCTQRDQTS